MSFCLQLRMILWKNYLLRRRQKLRCLTEVIWPIFLFLILLWVRTKNLRVEMHECHFTEKALPTTGGLPFFQSFLCTYNNTCFTYINDSKVTDSINHESFLKFINEVKAIINSDKVNQIRETVDDVNELIDLIENIDLDKESAFESLSVPNLIRDSNSLKKEIKRRKLPLSSHSIDSLMSSDLALQSLIIERKGVPAYRENISLLLCNETLMHNIVKEREPDDVLYAELCKLSAKDVDNLLASAIKEMDTKDVVKQIGKRFETDRRKHMSFNDSMKFMKLSSDIINNLQTLRTYSDILDKIVNASSDFNAAGEDHMKTNTMFLQLLAKFDSYLCGREAKGKNNDERSAFEPGNEPSRFDSLNERLKDRVEFKYEYDENVTRECNDLFQTFEESTTLKAIWMMYKPLLRGKLLYTPKTAATERIMKKINDTFAELNKLRGFLNLTQTVVQTATSLLRDSAVAHESMKKLINLSGRKGPVSLLIDNKTMDDYEEMEEIFQKYSNESMEDQRYEAIDDFYDIVKNLTLFLDCMDYDKIIDFPTENDAMVAGMKLLEVNRLIAVIVFEGQTSDDLTPFTTYKIRMSSDRVDDTDKLHDGMRRPGPRMRPFIDLKYLTFGFAFLQDLIEHYMIIEHTGLKSEDLPGYYMQQFPYPCYVNDHFIVSISGTFPLLMVLSWVYSCAVIVKSIVYEKEQRLKETMHVMGLSNGVHWVGWFIDSLCPMLITIVLLTLILSYGNILRSSNPWIISAFLFVYCLATIGQAFLISVFFSKANIAAASGGLLFFVLYLPYALLMRWISFMSPIVKFLLCLSSNVAFGLGASYFSMYEEQGSGLQWKNIGDSPLYTDTYSLMIVMLILLFDFILYLLLAWYIEGVAPGQYGIARPWYFPVSCSYWRGTRGKKLKNDYTEDINNLPKENCEPEPTSLTVGISIHNLSKVYDNGKTAVKGLTLNFYQDQITSFLGHNGAGKTTTISILTGLYPPSSGTALINGMDIRKDMDSIRHSLGMCPQHNVLFDQLSVEEHLIFFSTLRGKRSKKEIRQEVDQMLNDLELPNKKKSLASDLSGGMQRKLSIAIAFIGGSKTVILDEPTSGVDPYSRRKIWELLIKYKEGRTVVLTTHYMDEADLLGDRIAIISGGQLQCVGSSLFLKNRFGSGYYLTVDVLLLGKNQKLTQDSIQKIYVHIVSIIPSARLHDQIGTELIFILPVRSKVDELNRLFNSLEENKKLLRINSYGISDTSLEEIFLRVAENAELAAATNERANEPVKTCCGRLKQLFRGERSRTDVQRSASIVVENTAVPVTEEREAVRPSGFKKWRQYKALMIKRFHHTRRRKKALLSELVLPAVFLSFTLLITNILPAIGDRPPLVLKPSLYGSPRFIFETIENDTEPKAKLYQSSLLSDTGLGMICCTNYSEYGPLDIRDNDCLEETTYYKGAKNVSSFGEACSCETGNQICPKTSGLPIPASTEIMSSELMYEFTNSNISDWILKTFRPYMKSNSKDLIEMFFPMNDSNSEENKELYLHTFNDLAFVRMGGFNLAYRAPVPEVSLETIAKIIMLNKSSPEDFRYKENNIRIWYNNKGWATSVAYLNAVNNFVLRGSLPAGKSANASNFGIRAINHPMNYTRKQLNMEALQQNGLSVLHAVAVIFALSFVPASFTLYIIEDRVTNSKHLQLVSGLNRVIYWVSTYTWDMCCYTFVVFLCVLVFVAFGEDAYISERNLGAFVTLLMLYGISCTPLMYPLSFFFKVPSSSFVVLGCSNMFIGIITTLTTFVLSVFEDDELKAVNAVVKKVFLIFPHYCLGDGLMKLTTNYMIYYSYLAFDVEVIEDNFAWNQLGRNYFFMAIFAVLYLIMTLLLEYEVFVRIHRLIRKKVTPDESTIINEDDVKTERARIKSGDTTQDILVINDLFKIYSRAGKKPSVNQICAGMKQGECFGLLGLNGAGKTTTFKMLTGEIKANAGDAFVNGNSITKNMSKVRSHIGYCPQFDALDSSLTPSEHLYFYARIRNLPAKQVPGIVNSCLERLGLTGYSNRCAGTLSGGNKRKLATAIAVLGSPPLIFLDEPTSGMDPRARRFLWSTVQTLVKEGHCVILTSHSMEECQALCTRLTIMVNGQFKCIGSSQHLKNKYGGGYSLTMHCSEGETNVTALKNYIRQKLRKAVLQEEHHTRLRYQLPRFSHQLPEVFSVMETARVESIIIDYSLSQTTLEDVFIQFAMDQSEQEKQKNKIKLRSALHCSPCSRCCLVRKPLKIMWQSLSHSLLNLKKKSTNHEQHRVKLM